MYKPLVNILSVLIISLATMSSFAQPAIVGNLQSEIGCSSDWLPDCSESHMSEVAPGIWKSEFSIPAGDWEFKVALGDSWDVNYGAGAELNGANIPFTLAETTSVQFYFNEVSHWLTSNRNSVVASVAGSFQSELGCADDWSPSCLITWMQDIDGDGVYTFESSSIPVGNYAFKIALNESWDVSYGTSNGGDISLVVSEPGENVVITFDSATNTAFVGDVFLGDLREARAYWLSENVFAIDVTNEQAISGAASLHYSAAASLSTGVGGIVGGSEQLLRFEASGLSEELLARFPHLSDHAIFTLPADSPVNVRDIVQHQVAFEFLAEDGNVVTATSLQWAGMLDDLFPYSGALGAEYSEDAISSRLWAPTARSVSVNIYETPTSESLITSVDMIRDPISGVWLTQGGIDWDRKYYRFTVEVFDRHERAFVTNTVSDPYSMNTSVNGVYSQFINLMDQNLKPEGWATLVKPPLDAPEDMVIYELHVRDFSISDESVPTDEQGTFKAFTKTDSNGMVHLNALAESGLTHVHFLPFADCGYVNENRDEHSRVAEDLTQYAADSEHQQEVIEGIRSSDGFNWCYGTQHFFSVEGSYSTNPEGVARVVELREMVSALNAIGLRVILDVVYNHTAGELRSENSVLDKIVPDYFHRLNNIGVIERSTCCANAATENTMMEKLMVDSIINWAKQYKIDGFRFDLMGHHSKENLLNIRAALDELRLDQDGVDGTKIYLYGEGWNFGEVANDARFEQATIGNMSGTGIGTFNDRFRNAVRGGHCCDTGENLINRQGYISGLYLDPNAESSEGLQALLQYKDAIRAGMAGSIASVQFVGASNVNVNASEVTIPDTNDGVGYAFDPQETINYIAAHDNETLYDILAYKAPLDTNMQERVRIQNLGNSIVLLS